MRLRPVALVVFLALALPGSAHAANLFVLSGSDAANSGGSIPGLISLDDGGGEFQQSSSGGAVIAGTGVGPVVYNSGGNGSISQFAGGKYSTLATNVPGVVGMTQTGRGLVVAIGNKLQYVAGGARTDVPHGTLGADGPWVSIATQPNGHLLGWAWNNGWGSLYDLDLASGAVTSQDFTGQINDPLFNNRTNGSNGPAPIANAGDIAVDGTGGVWVANAEGDGSNAHIYHALPGGSLQLVTGGPSSYYKPHITATGDGNAYVTTSDYSAPPYISDVYKISGANTSKVTLASSKLANSAIFDLAIDRCYTTCAVAPPNTGGGGGGGGTAKKQKLSAPAKSVKLGKKGLNVKLKCAIACSVTVTGKLAFGKAKKGKKATAAASNKVKKTTAKLKAGKSKTVVIKLSKAQRTKVKRALRKKQKVYAKLKLVVKAQGVKSVTRSLKLRVR